MEFRPARHILEDYPADWPPKECYVDSYEVTTAQYEQLRDLVDSDAGETAIDTYLRENRTVMAACLSFFRTGHHGTWIIPQQIVRPPQRSVGHGLKPDFLLGGKSSDGFAWKVLELKGASESIFATSGRSVFFGSAANRGIFQLLEYIDYCSEAQAYMRDSLRLTGFREPSGLLLIGRDRELRDYPRRARFKAAWNRANAGALEIRTYDALVRAIETILDDKSGR